MAVPAPCGRAHAAGATHGPGSAMTVEQLRARVDELLDDGRIPYQERLFWAGFYEGMGVDATPLDLQRLITRLKGLREPATSGVGPQKGVS